MDKVINIVDKNNKFLNLLCNKIFKIKYGKNITQYCLVQDAKDIKTILRNIYFFFKNLNLKLLQFKQSNDDKKKIKAVI